MVPEAARILQKDEHEEHIVNAISTLLNANPQRELAYIDPRSFLDEGPNARLCHFKEPRSVVSYTLIDPQDSLKKTKLTFLLKRSNVGPRTHTIDEGWIEVRLSSDNKDSLPKTIGEIAVWLKKHTSLKSKVIILNNDKPLAHDERNIILMILDLEKIRNPESVILICSSALPHAPIKREVRRKESPDFLLQCTVASFLSNSSGKELSSLISIPPKPPPLPPLHF